VCLAPLEPRNPGTPNLEPRNPGTLNPGTLNPGTLNPGTLNTSTQAIGVLISGRGSNLQAIIDAIASGRLDARIAVVISNRADAGGLERARAAGIETVVMPHKAYPDRAAYDRALADALKSRGVVLVCLAGFMRLLGPAFIDEFPNAVLNVHPSLLPSFPGVDGQRQALEH